MLALSKPLPFVLALIALQVTPGPDMLLIIARGIGQGPRIAVLSTIGATLLAGAVQLPFLVLGVTSLLAISPVAFELLRWIGAGYLIFIGVKLLAGAQRSGESDVSAGAVSGWKALRQGMVSNLTNPKALAFMLAFLPQFVDPTSGWSIGMQLLVLGTLQKLSGFLALAIVALLSGALGSYISRRPNLIAWQKRFAGAVMTCLGIHLALNGSASTSRG